MHKQNLWPWGQIRNAAQTKEGASQNASTPRRGCSPRSRMQTWKRIGSHRVVGRIGSRVLHCAQASETNFPAPHPSKVHGPSSAASTPPGRRRSTTCSLPALFLLCGLCLPKHAELLALLHVLDVLNYRHPRFKNVHQRFALLTDESHDLPGCECLQHAITLHFRGCARDEPKMARGNACPSNCDA